MKKNIPFLLFVFISFFIFSQEGIYKKEKDSITYYLKSFKKKNDLTFLEKAVKIAQKTNIDSHIKETNIEYGLQSFLKKNSRGLKISQQNLLKLYTKTKDSFVLAKYYHYKALSKKNLFKNDSSFYYYHKSKNISILLKDSLEVARRLLSMSNMQSNERDFLGCEISLIEGLKYIEPLNEIRYTASFYNNLGLILSETGRQKEARAYYEKFFELNKQKLDKHSKNRSNLNYYLNVALTYNRDKEYKKSIAFFKKGLAFDNIEYKFPKIYQLLQEGLADTYYDSGSKEKALKGFYIALKSKEKHNNLFEQSNTHSLLAYYFLEDKNNEKALFHAKKSYHLANQTNNNKRILTSLKYLSQLTKGEKGKQFLQEYIKLSDSINYRERNLKNQFAKVRYETEKKDKENTSLKQENTQKQLLLESEQQQKTIGWLIAGASILFLAFGYTIASNRRKKLLFESKLQQVEVREKERQLIAKSLHDEVAGDIRMLHLKLAKTNQFEEAKSLDLIKENVRNLSHQLSSESFDKVSFKDQIINLVSDYFEPNFRIKVKEIDSVNWKEINNSIKRTLFLSIRESIQNSKKHAEASEINLNFSETKKEITLTISDNGIGFNTNVKKKGIGLKNIKERIESINGVFTVKSELGKGTTTKIVTKKNGK